MDEQETGVELVEGVEVQPDTGETALDADAGLGMPLPDMEQTAGDLETSAEDVLASPLDSPGPGPETSDTLDADRVAQIVDAVLQSDRVEDLFQSVEYTLQVVMDTVTATSESEDTSGQEPMLVISADDLLDRLEARQAESAQAAQTAAMSALMQNRSVAAASAVKSGEIVPLGEGEVIPVGEGDISLTVIETLLESLISYFIEDGTEDDGAILVTIKNTVEEIKASVEPHPLMETPFEEYTVLEGLLLVLVLWLVVLNPCIRMIKGGFSWLLS